MLSGEVMPCRYRHKATNRLGLGKTVASLLSLCSLSRRAPNFELPFPAPDRFPRSGRNLVRSSRLHRVLHVQVHLWTAQETRGKQGQWRSGTGHLVRRSARALLLTSRDARL